MASNQLKTRLVVDSSGFNKGLQKASQSQRQYAEQTKKELSKVRDQYKKVVDKKLSLLAAMKKVDLSTKKGRASFRTLKKDIRALSGEAQVYKTRLKELSMAEKKHALAARKAANQIKKQSRKKTAALQTLRTHYLRIIAAIGSVVLVTRKLYMLMKDASQSFIEYQYALAEVNTLIDGKGGLTDSTKKFIKQQSLAYGKSQTENLKAYYQIVSAGITNQVEANKVLEQSNRAAIAGLTDIRTAADGLTSVLNAYSGTNLTAARATDIFFQTVKLGKTTFPELAKNVGQVLPLARAVGVSFEEVAAALATATLNGLNTAEATTQLKGILKTFLKPANETVEAMLALGIELDKNAIKQKGFLGVWQEILKVTDGNEKKLAKLFPRVRGLGLATALTNDKLEKFTKVLNKVKNSAGALDDSFGDVDKTLKLIIDRELQKRASRVKEFGKEIQGLTLDMVRLKNAVVDYGIFFGRVFNHVWQVNKKTFLEYQKTRRMRGWLSERKARGGMPLPAPEGHKRSGVTELGNTEADRLKRERIKSQYEDKQIVKEIREASGKIKEELEGTLEGAGMAFNKIFDTSFDKILEGIKKIKQATLKAIRELRKEHFGGEGFASLGRAYASLKEGGRGAQSTFSSFKRQVAPESLTPQAISSLAQASKDYEELNRAGQSAVQGMINKIKELKGIVEATDIAGAVSAAGEGFSANLGIGSGLLKDTKAAFDIRRKNLLGEESQKIEQEIAKGLEDFSKKLLKVADKFESSSIEFHKSVIELRKTLQKDFTDKAHDFQKITTLTGDREVELEQELSKKLQNNTSSLRDSIAQGGL